MSQILSIVIPAYNEEESIVSVIKGTRKALDKKGVSYELIVVNDGSTDSTEKLAKKEKVILLTHPYKKGYGMALKTGIKQARGGFILIMDADDQHYPEDILKLTPYKNQYDMVVGARTNITSFVRDLGRKFLATFASYLAEFKIPDLNSGFRLIKKEMVLKYFDILPNSFSFSSTITLACIQEGYNIKYVPIKIKQRKTGKSTLKIFRDGTRFFMLLLRLTVLFNPLRVFLPMSLGLFSIGLGYTISNIIKFFDIPDSGIFLMLSAIILFFFGLIADQISYIRKRISKL